MNDERKQAGAALSAAEKGGGANDGAAPASDNRVKVFSCANCDGPVASSADKCFACGAPLTGKEFPYIARRPASPDIAGMVKWWAIFSVVVFALGGFSFGIGSMIAFSALTLVYGIRILRASFL
jgi:hypothetical protein